MSSTNDEISPLLWSNLLLRLQIVHTMPGLDCIDGGSRQLKYICKIRWTGLRNERLNSHKPMTFIKHFHRPAQNVCEFLGKQSRSYNRLQSRLSDFCLPVQSYGDKTQQQITSVSALNSKAVMGETHPKMTIRSSLSHSCFSKHS